ncbi:MAG: putative porin [Nitrospirota bacterium]
MTQRAWWLVMAAALLIDWQAPAQAADKKPLSEVLYEAGVLTKEQAAGVQETVWPSFVDRATLSSDLRVRHESFFKQSDAKEVDRHRQRFRLRIGAKIKVKSFLVVVRVASGTGEQQSTNQSFDNLFTQKAIWIDHAYVAFNSPSAPFLTLAAGRMQNPFTRVYTSDLVWDDDVNPEGFAEQLKFSAGDAVIFVNLAQLVLDEDSGDNHDQWMMGEQLGTTINAGAVKATLAGALYQVLNATEGTFGSPATQDGNTRVGGVLVNRYHVMDLMVALSTKVGDLPFQVMGDYVRNLADTTTGGNGVGTATGNVGYQVGAILGKASDPNTWETAYFYKVVETDATLADLSDSDFGDGGLARRGHIAWVAYSPTKFLQGKVKFFMTKSDGVARDDINRLQADVAIKF